MTTKSKQLVRAGHELASELKADCGAVDVRSVAALLNELADALDVQSARSDALAAALKASEANDADARCHVAEPEEKCAALAAENAALKSAHPQPFGPEMMKALDAYEKHQDEVPETGMLDAFFILRDSIRVTTPATDAWVNEQRDAILDATFKAAKQEVERRFGRTFQDCAWLARRNSDTQMKGAVEMAEWVELYAAQFRGSQDGGTRE
ncbi:hypothetical protein EGT71_22155 [Atlantibacter subterranea]|uniref:Ead/Ea22-like family protein n=1 Tax=Atlantibacter subterraneus TaxID=255519 RepID=A0A3R9EUH0_9ENTR|nr:hypothetical protein [Atlantibacter subterranea]RSB59013.1 hypothetical protein EGK67_21905 [Atlantibacter subterranea]RSE01182.1 hypothetical protein EGT84_22145 [Atlantibacter subterranea]RSE22142.1 hypothetical protein EGT71_22155 [Atlantibacter subterranea]